MMTVKLINGIPIVQIPEPTHEVTLKDKPPINPQTARKCLDRYHRMEEALRELSCEPCCLTVGCSVDDPKCSSMKAKQALSESGDA